MTARVTVLLGPPRSGKTHALLGRFRAALSGRPAGGVWIAPTHRSAADIRLRLLDETCGACLGPAVLTFAQFVDRVLASGDAAIRPLSEFAKREIVQALIAEAARSNQLAYYGAIADTSGFVDRVAAQISEWKRLEIWPEHLRDAASRCGIRDKDRDLLLLYEQYQQRLAAGQYYDAEGRFWIAREALRGGQRRPFEQARSVVVDGFSDFTRTQHEILQELAAWVDNLWISLPVEREKARGDLFAKPRETLARLHERHPGVVAEEWLDRRATGGWPAWEHVERELFKNPRHATPAEDVSRIEIVAAAGPLDELEQIGRRIKRLLVQGDPNNRAAVRPSDIGVVFRSLNGREPLVRETFERLGLPYAIDSRPMLVETRSLAALREVLALERDDWPFPSVLSCLLNSCIRPDWPEFSLSTAAAAELSIRELQVHKGRMALLRAMERRATQRDEARPAAGNADREGDDEGVKWAAAALPLATRLAGALASLPRSAAASEWTRSLARLADELKLRPKSNSKTNADADDESAAWDAFFRAVHAAGEIVALDGSARQWKLDEACGLVDDILSHEPLPTRIDETGRVRVLSAASVRSLSVPYLFLADLSEKSFPPPDRDDRLYSEAENRRLREAGLPVVLRAERSQEEMLLFYEAVTRATRQLCLSYPGLDEKGNTLLPSPFLVDLEHACGRGRIERAVADDLNPIPAVEQPSSVAEWRVMAVDQAARGKPELLAALMRDAPDRRVAANVAAGMRLTHERSRRGVFGQFDGMLSGHEALRLLREQFSEAHQWSVSELEQYGQCPFQFLASRILKLSPLDDLGLDIDYLRRGSVVHEVLAALHERVNAVAGRGASPAALSSDALTQLVEELLQELVAPRGEESGIAGALVEVNRRQIRRWLANYGEQHAIYDAQWKDFDDPPTARLLEFAFGDKGRDGSETESQSAAPLTMRHGGHAVLLRGRIDRVDVGSVAGQSVFVVLDYKTGGYKPYTRDAILSGEWLQPTVYALAAEQALRGLDGEESLPWRAGYWFVAQGGMRDKSAPVLHECGGAKLSPTKEWRAMRQAAAERIVALTAGVRSGQFPMANDDEECTGRCEFATICRVQNARALEKAWQPPQPQSD